MSTVSRRKFLHHSFRTGILLAGAGVWPAAHGIVPFRRRGGPRLLLSLAAYSFRNYFKDADHERDAVVDPSRKIDLFQFLDYCAEQGCQGAELTSYYFPKPLPEQFLIRLKRHAFLRGIEISGTAVGNTFTDPKGDKRSQEIALVKRWIDHAQEMGAPHVRVFAGSAPRGMEKGQAKKLCIEGLEDCCSYAAAKGIFLGLENHGGIVAEAQDLLEIVQAVDSPALGINLDTGNFNTSDPYADLERCAPYAINVQLKGELHPRGQPKTAADLTRLVRILREANYQGYVALEYESAEDPWKAVPPLLRRMKELFQS
jgi:sugar phosphate isomerase/epimerase